MMKNAIVLHIAHILRFEAKSTTNFGRLFNNSTQKY